MLCFLCADKFRLLLFSCAFTVFRVNRPTGISSTRSGPAPLGWPQQRRDDRSQRVAEKLRRGVCQRAAERDLARF